MKKIELEIPDGKKAEWVNGVLTLIDETPKDIKERIKTFEDACEWCKENGFTELVETFDNANEWVENESKDIFAYLKLRIIVTALNEGWRPRFTENEYRYFPYFKLYTKAEIDKMDDGHKKKLWIWGGFSNSGSACGFGFSSSDNGGSDSASHISARLALKSAKLAEYCGEQFIDIWADYCFLNPRRDEKDS